MSRLLDEFYDLDNYLFEMIPLDGAFNGTDKELVSQNNRTRDIVERHAETKPCDNSMLS